MAVLASTPITNVDLHGTEVVPVSLVAGWVSLKTTGSIGTAVTNVPDIASSFNARGWSVKSRDLGRGTTIRVRALYPGDTSAVATSPSYRVWGRKRRGLDSLGVSLDASATDAYEWQILLNRNGDRDATLTLDITNDAKLPDASSGKYATSSDINENSHDCDGCDEFWIVPTVGASITSTLGVATGDLQMKLI